MSNDPSRAVEAALEVIAEREPEIHAFAYLDEERARREAAQAGDGPLSGITVGVKDLFDTADQPTAYGSPIYADHRPMADAGIVALLRSAGAVVLGKTVTTEFAWSFPGPTLNPHRTTHTPGGSSSGSAAGAAAGMFDLGVGSQTAGSVIRPSSFCGVFGLKPTIGLLPITGAKAVAPTLDTVGFLASDLEMIDRVVRGLLCLTPSAEIGEVQFALARTDVWDAADEDTRRIVEDAASALGATERDLPESFVGLTEEQTLLQAYEGLRSLLWERATQPELLSGLIRARLDAAESIELAEYERARSRMAIARHPVELEELFGPVDVLVTPAAVGEAPADLTTTGDACFNRLWTLLGCPALTVPGATGRTGLPIGVQLVARPFREDVLITAGRRLAAVLT